MGTFTWNGIKKISDNGLSFEYSLDDPNGQVEFYILPRSPQTLIQHGVSRTSSPPDPNPPNTLILPGVANNEEIDFGNGTPIFLNEATPYKLAYDWESNGNTGSYPGWEFWTYGYLFQPPSTFSKGENNIAITGGAFKTGGIYQGSASTDWWRYSDIKYVGIVYGTSSVSGITSNEARGVLADGYENYISLDILNNLKGQSSSPNFFDLYTFVKDITGLQSSTTYYFRVVTHYINYDTADNLGSPGISRIVYSDEWSETTDSPSGPSQISLTLSKQSGGVQLNWNDVGATSYEIRRGTSQSNMQAITSVSGTSYLDAPLSDGTYYFMVLGNNGINSVPVSITLTPSQSAPDDPIISATYTQQNAIEINWTNTGDTYDLEIKINGGSWSLLQNDISWPVNGVTDVKGPGQYQYRVKAFNTVGESNWVESNIVTIEEPVVVPDIPNLNATQDEIRKVILTWGADPKATHFKVYRDNGALPIYNGPYPSLGYIIDEPLVPGNYSYKIKGYNSNDGTESPDWGYATGEADDYPVAATPATPVLQSRTETTMDVICITPGAKIVCTNFQIESNSPINLNGLAPDTLYSFYSYIPEVPGVSLRSNNSSTVSFRTLREKPAIPTASEITKESMKWTSNPGSTITCTGPNGYNKVQLSGTVFTGMLPNTRYSAFAQFVAEPGHSVSNPSSTTSVFTLKEKHGTPTKPQYEDLTHRTTRLISNATIPIGEPVWISCNGEIKMSGSIWTWLEPNTQYTAYAWVEESENNLASDVSETLTFITPEAPIEPDIDLIGFMNDGSRAPQELLDENLIITSSNPSVVEIRGKQILVVGSGYTRITFSVNGKTTFTDLNIV